MKQHTRRHGGAGPYHRKPESELHRAVLDCLNARKNRILLIAASSLPESQFKAFRTLVLDELGQVGLESELEHIFAGSTGMERAGIHDAGKGVPE